MAVFDPKQVVVLLDGKEISDWADGADVINATNQVGHRRKWHGCFYCQP